MKFDKKIFEEYLYNRNYSSCIYILDKEIKEILTQKIQNYDNSFKYTTLKELKNKCIEHLDYFSKLELKLLDKHFDIYHSEINEAFLDKKHHMVNPIELTDLAILKTIKKI